jgi:putative SOS response-associated peptidase YedK
MWFMKFDDACGDFSLEAYADDLYRRFSLRKIPPRDYKSFDTRPANTSAVVYADDDGKPVLEDMKWGFQLERKTPPHKMLLFNTRDDNAFKGFWKPMITKRRALIPATGYFEWTKPPKGTPKQKYFYHPKQMDLFSFAGVWSNWKDSVGQEIKAFSIITTEPNKEAAKVHNRMPVILRKEDEASYLDPSKTEQKDIEPFLHPYRDNGLEVFEVSNNTRAFESNDNGLIAPLNSA